MARKSIKRLNVNKLKINGGGNHLKSAHSVKKTHNKEHFGGNRHHTKGVKKHTNTKHGGRRKRSRKKKRSKGKPEKKRSSRSSGLFSIFD